MKAMNSLKSIWEHLCETPIVLLLSLLAIVPFVFPGLGNFFEFQFADISLSNAHGVVSCNWLHWSASHLFWDLLMFYIVGRLCELSDRKAFIAVLLLSAPFIPLAIQIACPELGSYRGLSGIDTALFALLGTCRLRESILKNDYQGVMVYGLLLAAMFLKILYETITHDVLFADKSTFTPVALAHLTGSLIGIGVASSPVIQAELREQPGGSTLAEPRKRPGGSTLAELREQPGDTVTKSTRPECQSITTTS